MSADAAGSVQPPSQGALPWAIRWWWVWAALALVTGAITVAAAEGFNIVDLELAGSIERADEVVADTDADTIRLAIYWDFVFILCYALALWTGSQWARHQFAGGTGSSIGTPIASGALAAAALDIVENVSMLGYLNGWGDWAGWATVARATAIPKFLLVFVSIAYILIGVAAWGLGLVADRHRRR